MDPLRLCLASASPRRLELLRAVGLDPVARPANLDELLQPGEAASAHVARLAEEKGRSVASGWAAERPAVILAADTAVVLDGAVLGKPDDRRHAEEMLRRLRGRTHEVLTGVFLIRTDDGRTVGDVESTRVTFRDYDDATIRAYVAGGEPADKAGAYGIQGLGALLSLGIEGSWSNVVGLPLERLHDWFAGIGLDLTSWVSWQRR